MPTFTALTTLVGEDAATALAEALEKMTPEPTGVGVFEIEDDSGLWEVGAYFLDPPDMVMLEVLALAFDRGCFFPPVCDGECDCESGDFTPAAARRLRVSAPSSSAPSASSSAGVFFFCVFSVGSIGR